MRKVAAITMVSFFVLLFVMTNAVTVVAQEHPYSHRHTVSLENSTVIVDYLKTTTVKGTITTTFTPYDYAQIYAVATVKTENAGGWVAVFTQPSFRMSGTSVDFEVMIINGPPIKKDTVIINLNFTIEPADTGTQYAEANLIAKASTYSVGLLSMYEAPKTIRPNGITTYQIEVEHLGNYFEHYTLWVKPEEGWIAEIERSLVVFPGGKAFANLTICAPETFYASGKVAIINVYARPLSNPDIVYNIPVVVLVKGFYIPPYVPWIVIPVIIIIALVLIFILLPIHRRLAEYRGRPQRPWKLPKEKKYLLDVRDTSGLIAVMRAKRLMREEYRSALLWWKWEKKSDRIHKKEWKKTHRDEWKAQASTRRREKKVAKLQKKVDKKQYRLDRKFEKRWKKGWKKPYAKWEKACKKVRRAHRKAFKKERKTWRKAKKRAKRAFKKDKKRTIRAWEKESARIEKEYARTNRRRVKQGLDEEVAPLPVKPDLGKPQIAPKPKRTKAALPPEPGKPQRPKVPQYSIDEPNLKILRPGEKPRPPKAHAPKGMRVPIEKRISGAVTALFKHEKRAPKEPRPVKSKPVKMILTPAERERAKMRRRADAGRQKELAKVQKERARIERGPAKERSKAEAAAQKEKSKIDAAKAREQAKVDAQKAKAQKSADKERAAMNKQRAKAQGKIDAENNRASKIAEAERKAAQKTVKAAEAEKARARKEMEKARPRPVKKTAAPAKPDIPTDELQRRREKEIAKIRKRKEKERAAAKKAAERAKKNAEQQILKLR